MPALGGLCHFSKITDSQKHATLMPCESTLHNSGHARPICGRPHLCSGIRKNKGVAAITLVEAMIALGVMVLFTAACLSTIVVSQVSVRKAKEEAIAIDFLTKYAENLKALPFTSLVAGQPINWEFSTAPQRDSHTSYGQPHGFTYTPAYQLFYTDLLWFANRNPTMTVTLTPSAVVGHDIEVTSNWIGIRQFPRVGGRKFRLTSLADQRCVAIMKLASVNAGGRACRRAFTLVELMVAMSVGVILAGTVVLLLIQAGSEEQRGYADSTVEERAYILQADVTSCLRGMSSGYGMRQSARRIKSSMAPTFLDIQKSISSNPMQMAFSQRE